MKKILILTLILFTISFEASADFKPLEKEVKQLRETLSKTKTISKAELEKSLLSIKSKTPLIKNEIARVDLTGDVDILIKKYITNNKKSSANTKDVDYWLVHIVDDLAMFVKLGITE